MPYVPGGRVFYRVMFPNRPDEWKTGTIEFDLGGGRYSILPDDNPNWWAERDAESLRPIEVEVRDAA